MLAPLHRKLAFMTATMGDRIKAKREALGLSRADLAEKLGISEQAVGQWERNITVNIRPDHMLKLTELLHVSHKYLIRGTSLDKAHRAVVLFARKDGQPTGELLAKVWDELSPETKKVIYSVARADLGEKLERRRRASRVSNDRRSA